MWTTQRYQHRVGSENLSFKFFAKIKKIIFSNNNKLLLPREHLHFSEHLRKHFRCTSFCMSNLCFHIYCTSHCSAGGLSVAGAMMKMFSFFFLVTCACIMSLGLPALADNQNKSKCFSCLLKSRSNNGMFFIYTFHISR